MKKLNPEVKAIEWRILFTAHSTRILEMRLETTICSLDVL